jgi:hypothetical protein
MKFVTIRYSGTTPYKDRTPLKNEWEPGEEKLVSERVAKTLQGYLEFQRVDTAAPVPPSQDPGAGGGDSDDDPAAAALLQAQQAEAEAAEREKKAKKLTEDTLLEVSKMSKDVLADYAKQNYGVELDTKAKVGDLRNQVTALVQGGRP